MRVEQMDDIRVLLVDDEEEFTSALAERLNLRGIRTTTACRGEEALEMIEADPPHVVVLDMKMPGLSGKEILARIKSRHPQVNVILLTGQSPAEIGGPGSGHELCDYMMKPVNIDDLIVKIRSAVSPE
jgi:DNA-binding NtrC family response regulator